MAEKYSTWADGGWWVGFLENGAPQDKSVGVALAEHGGWPDLRGGAAEHPVVGSSA